MYKQRWLCEFLHLNKNCQNKFLYISEYKEYPNPMDVIIISMMRRTEHVFIWQNVSKNQDKSLLDAPFISVCSSSIGDENICNNDFFYYLNIVEMFTANCWIYLVCLFKIILEHKRIPIIFLSIMSDIWNLTMIWKYSTDHCHFRSLSRIFNIEIIQTRILCIFWISTFFLKTNW